MKFVIHRRHVVLLSFATVAACSQNDADVTPLVLAAREQLLQPRPADYRLGAGDKVRVIVFNEEQLSGEHTVDPGGNISIPLAGVIVARDRTGTDLAAEIGRRLRAGNFLREPNVSVQVTQTRPFYVLGEVQKPGEFTYRAGLSLNAAVAMAGGFTFRANQRRIFVTREAVGREVPVASDVGMVVEPGDVVRVVERFF